MAPVAARAYLPAMTNDHEATHVTKARRRLSENREWVRRWATGKGRAESSEMLRRRDKIREDVELLGEWGETDAPRP
jgi:hypothetical protein